MFSNRSTLRYGLIVGLIAYAAVAAFYSMLDLLAARGGLFTVNMLGRAMFRDVRDPAVLLFPTRLDVVAIFWYNALHLVVALAIGVVATALVRQASRHSARAPLVLSALVAGGVITIATVTLLTEPIRPVLPWWSIVVANVLAAGLAGTYLLLRASGPWLRAEHTPRTRASGTVT